MPEAESQQLWGGRFAASPTSTLLQLTTSIAEDMRLLQFDLEATKAHARVLAAAGLLEDAALPRLDDACRDLLERWEKGELPVAGNEDVHSLVERWLTEHLGEVGRQIHAGRSRNDLVATDLRLWARHSAANILSELGGLIRQLADLAEEHAETLMPSYTHLQRAQPVSLGFHLTAHAFSLLRDGGRFAGAAAGADQSPLGAGAVAGTTLPLDPAIGATELGFSNSYDNAMDAVSDRDFLCDLVYASAMCGVHLSRLCEEIVLWTSSEFGFARLADAWATGSSMMPQKKNPDLAELIRARTGGGIGDLVALLTVLKALPLAYNRDLQETKKHAFAAVDRVSVCLQGMRGLLSGLSFDARRLSQAAESGGLWATDLAEVLVSRGVAFRDAHAAVGSLVAELEQSGTDLADADADLLKKHHPALTGEDLVVADALRSLTERSGPGGPSPSRVREQAALIRKRAANLPR